MGQASFSVSLQVSDLRQMRLQVQGRSSGSEDLSKQPGVVRADILRAAWTKKTLAAAFIAYDTSFFFNHC